MIGKTIAYVRPTQFPTLDSIDMTPQYQQPAQQEWLLFHWERGRQLAHPVFQRGQPFIISNQ